MSSADASTRPYNGPEAGVPTRAPATPAVTNDPASCPTVAPAETTPNSRAAASGAKTSAQRAHAAEMATRFWTLRKT
eukprot:336278-Chlamydomonas_euryale.AAC.1